MTLDGLIEKMELWHFDYVEDELTAIVGDDLAACDALLMGRLTYESFASAWPDRAGDPMADKFNAMAKYVASTTLTDPEWNNTTVLQGDLVTAVTELKQQPGDDIMSYGIGPVARTLLDNGLLDVIRLWVHPVIVGTGSPDDLLFGECATTTLRLTDSQTLGSGVVLLTYEVPAAS